MGTCAIVTPEILASTGWVSDPCIVDVLIRSKCIVRRMRTALVLQADSTCSAFVSSLVLSM